MRQWLVHTDRKAAELLARCLMAAGSQRVVGRAGFAICLRIGRADSAHSAVMLAAICGHERPVGPTTWSSPDPRIGASTHIASDGAKAAANATSDEAPAVGDEHDAHLIRDGFCFGSTPRASGSQAAPTAPHVRFPFGATTCPREDGCVLTHQTGRALRRAGSAADDASDPRRSELRVGQRVRRRTRVDQFLGGSFVLTFPVGRGCRTCLVVRRRTGRRRSDGACRRSRGLRTVRPLGHRVIAR